MCLGCGIPLIFKVILRATEDPIIVSNATGCLEVCTTIFPRTAWNCMWVHSAFENAAATAAGVEAMYKSLKNKGKIPADKKIKFLGVGGDGGTYDIGLQALSGHRERGLDIVYVCYDNNVYANTGGQRSSATPLGASATTSPAGSKSPGKVQQKKDLTKILAADTCVGPLYEVENGTYKINYRPKEKKPVLEWLKSQGRFRHLFKEENAWMLEAIQKEVDKDWNDLNKLAEISGA